MRAEDFWARVEYLRTGLSIAPRGGGVRDRKRIALAVTNAFLTAGVPVGRPTRRPFWNGKCSRPRQSQVIEDLPGDHRAFDHGEDLYRLVAAGAE